MRKRLTNNDIWGAAMGWFAAVSQVVLLRESLCVAGGNELSAAVSFTGWFVGVALAAAVSRRTARMVRTHISLSCGAVTVVLAGMLLLRLHRIVLGIGIGEAPGLVELSGVLLFGLMLGGGAMGALFTISSLRLPLDVRAPVARLFAAESLGAVLGGTLFYFVFAGNASHLASFGIAGGILFLGAAATQRRLARGGALCLAAVFFVCVASGVTGHLDGVLENRAFKTLRKVKLVATEQSAYGRLNIAADQGQFELWVNGTFDHVFSDPYDRPVPVHLALTSHPNPRDILILGGGPSDRLQAALAHHPARVVLTYLDDKLERFTLPYLTKSTQAALRDPRVEIVHDDGRHYVARAKTKFDVVLVFAPPPKNAGENRFFTPSFYQDLARILKPGGLAAVIAPGGANVLSPEAADSAASILKTMSSKFSKVVIIAGLETLLLAGGENVALTADPSVFAARYRKRSVVAEAFSARRFQDLLDPTRREERLATLRRSSAKINTDALPVVYAANLALWERGLGGAEHNTAGQPLSSILARSAGIFFVVPLLGFIIWRVSRKGRDIAVSLGAAVTVGGTGAAGMASQIVTMLAFQTSFGTLYSAIALISGIFMLGLAVGGAVSRHISAGAQLRDVWILDGAVAAYLLLTGPILGAGAGHSIIFYAWSFVGGGLTGFSFPLCLRLAAREYASDERPNTSRIESADHIGAAFGAFVTGLVWIPAYGVFATCLLFAVLKLAGMTVWIGYRGLERRRSRG